MVRRSSRLKKKKKINYGEDNLFKEMLKRAGRAWNEVVDIFEDTGPVPRPKPKPQKPFKRKPLYRKRLEPLPKPPTRQIIRARQVKKPEELSAIEKDELEVDFDLPEQRVERIQKQEGPRIETGGRTVSKLRRRMFMCPGTKKS